MNTISIPTTQNIELEYPIASTQERFLAGFIDQFVLGIYIILFHYLVYTYSNLELSLEMLEADMTSWGVLYFLLWLPAVLYSLIMETTNGGQTVGKILTKTRTIRLDGSTPDTASYFLRWLFRLIDIWFLRWLFFVPLYNGDYLMALVQFLLFAGWIGLIFVAATKNNQRIGDLVSGTTVIKLKLVTSFLDTIYVETGDSYQLVFPEIRSLSDRDMSILKEVLDTGLKSRNPQLLQKLANKVKDVTGIKSNMPDQQFLETILADYNHFFGKKG
ncbi:MAG: RDD family protein [Bacteroidota bacterium]